MKHILCFILTISSLFAIAKPIHKAEVHFFKADDPHIKYIGRIDFSNPLAPRFWSPGVYIQAKFKGTSLEMVVNDENLYGLTYNYIEVVIDNNAPYRIQTSGKTNRIPIAGHLSPGVHTVTICKDTESGIGYLEFVGFSCEKLLTVSSPKRKIEFIGDSITCGSGIDQSVTKCNTGKWFDQHNAYMSYGPVTARALNAEWQLTSVSGIGMIYSCCDLKITMPLVFDKVQLRDDSIQWDFTKYTPDVVTICLGQNDGKQDSLTFCGAYVHFIRKVRSYYPKADIVCLSSPMANKELTPLLKKYITGIVQYVNKNGDRKVTYHFFPGGYNNGCGTHPDMAQHQLIAAELTAYLKGLEKW